MSYVHTSPPRGARVLLAVLAVLGASARARAQSADPALPPAPERAFLEVASERGAGYVGEVLRVRLRVGFEVALLRDELIQPFRRPLAVPAQVEAAWLDAVPGARIVGPTPPAADAPESADWELDPALASLAVNDAVVPAARSGEIERDGLRFATFELERQLVASAPLELSLAAPVLRFAYATEFREDLVWGRRPRNRFDAEVLGNALVLPVLPLPPPPSDAWPGDGVEPWTGAVGRLRLEADAAPRELAAGESVTLTLTITTEAGSVADLAAFDPPGLGGIAGFHSRGHRSEHVARTADAEARRVVVFDLVPRDADVQGIPALALPYFDPARGAWDVARSAPIPLRVEGAPRAGGLERVDASGVDGEAQGPSLGVMVGVVAGVLLLAALAAARVLRRAA